MTKLPDTDSDDEDAIGGDYVDSDLFHVEVSRTRVPGRVGGYNGNMPERTSKDAL